MAVKTEQTGGGAVLDAAQARGIKQSVLADVSCVLARANGADIDRKKAFNAARNVCEILFGHAHGPNADIPKLFWDTPLGRAVGVCCGDREDGAEQPLVRTTVHLPYDVAEQIRREAELQGKTISEVMAERLSRS
jgi:hypothetical protein